MQYKDCKARCNPLVDGTACNRDLDAVSQLFSQGRVSSCHQCYFYQQQDGNVEGFPECADQSTSSIYQKNCPTYADSESSILILISVFVSFLIDKFSNDINVNFLIALAMRLPLFMITTSQR